MWQDKRSFEKEIIDLGPDHYTMEEYTQCLKLLGKVNRWLGGFRATRKALKRLKFSPRSILEVGCGGGALCEKLSHWYPEAIVTGIDLDKTAVEEAKKTVANGSDRIHFEQQERKSLDYDDNAFDVVTTMLVCHHMNNEELITFLKESYRICTKAVIINDLQRHYLAYLSFSLITPILFPNRLIWHDGRLSIKRSFRKKEWMTLLDKAGFHKEQVELRWNWAFRWTLMVKKYEN